MTGRAHQRLWTLAGVLAVSWVLLCFQLGQRSLWVDEAATVAMIAGGPAEVVAAAARDVHPPLYFLTLRAWVQLAGGSDLALRWPSAAAGLVGVALLARLARGLAGSRAAVPAALLLGLNPAFLEFSRMARYYALLLALGVLATALLLRAVREPARRAWAAFGAAGLALLLVSYPGAILLGAHGLLLLWPAARRRQLWQWALTLGVTVLLYAPWLATQAGQQVERVSGFIVADLSRSLLGLALGLGAIAYTFGVGETLYPWRPEAWLGLAAVGALLWAAIRLRGVPAWQALGVAALSSLGVAMLTTFVAASVPFLNVPARALFALPFVSVAGALGWAALGARHWRAVVGVPLLLAWGASVFSLYTGQQFLNPIYYTPAREAAALVDSRAGPEDLVISDGDSVFDRYFLPAAGGRTHVYTHAQDQLAMLLSGRPYARVWVVLLERDRTEVASHAAATRQALASDYTHLETVRLLPIDPVYNQFKAALLRRPAYEYRLLVEVYAPTGE